MDFAGYDACFGPADGGGVLGAAASPIPIRRCCGASHVDARDGRRPAGPADGRGAAGQGPAGPAGRGLRRRIAEAVAAAAAHRQPLRRGTGPLPSGRPPMNVVRQVRAAGRHSVGRSLRRRAAGRRRTALPRRGDGWLHALEVDRWCAGGRRGPGAPGPLRPAVLDVGCGPGRHWSRSWPRASRHSASTCQRGRVASHPAAGRAGAGAVGVRAVAAPADGVAGAARGRQSRRHRARPGRTAGPDGRTPLPRRPVDRRDRAGRHRRAGHRPAGRERRAVRRPRALVPVGPAQASPALLRHAGPSTWRIADRWTAGGRHCVALRTHVPTVAGPQTTTAWSSTSVPGRSSRAEPSRGVARAGRRSASAGWIRRPLACGRVPARPVSPCSPRALVALLAGTWLLSGALVERHRSAGGRGGRGPGCAARCSAGCARRGPRAPRAASEYRDSQGRWRCSRCSGSPRTRWGRCSRSPRIGTASLTNLVVALMPCTPRWRWGRCCSGSGPRSGRPRGRCSPRWRPRIAYSSVRDGAGGSISPGARGSRWRCWRSPRTGSCCRRRLVSRRSAALPGSCCWVWRRSLVMLPFAVPADGASLSPGGAASRAAGRRGPRPRLISCGAG